MHHLSQKGGSVSMTIWWDGKN